MPKKLRAQQIVLDLPTEDGETWLNAVLQTIIKDGNYNTIQRMDRTAETHRKLSDVVAKIMAIDDPVTGNKIYVSGAGVAFLIKTFVVSWMQEDHGGTINELGDLIIEQ